MSEIEKLPEGFVSLNSDVVGFWNFELRKPIVFRPIGATMSDSSLSTPKFPKASILIFGDLTEPCSEIVTSDGEPIEAPAGARVGIWYRVGMSKVVNTFGSIVFMQYKGEIEVDRPLPMKAFTVAAKGEGRLAIPVLSDYRVESARIETPFDGGIRRPTRQLAKRPADGLVEETETDDVPF